MGRVFLCLFLTGLQAQTPLNDIDRALEQGNQEMLVGNLVPAEAALRYALLNAQNAQDQAREARADYQLAILGEIRQRPEDAEHSLVAAVDSCRRPDHKIPILIPLLYLHSFYFRHTEWKKDAETLREMVPLVVADTREGHMRFHAYSLLLSQALVHIKDYAAAEEVLRKIVPASRADKEALAKVLEKEGKKEEAKSLIASSQPKPPEANTTPPQLVTRVEPKYTILGRMARVNGTVLLDVEIDEAGRIKKTSVIVPLGFGLDENAIEAVKTWTFKPARKSGVAVSQSASIEISFRIS